MSPSLGILPYVSDLFDEDYDPLAPPPAPLDADEAGASASPAGSDDAHPSDGSFVGGDGVVRIWFDDAGRLAKVRVSPIWFKKLQGSQTLRHAFLQAFRLSSVRVASSPPAPALERDDAVPAPAGIDELRTRTASILALMDEWDAAVARRMAASPPPPPRPATGRVQGVTVTLNAAGHPWDITFDEEWLDDAQVGLICSSVLTATQRAYEAHVPEREEAAQERDHFFHASLQLLDQTLRTTTTGGSND